MLDKIDTGTRRRLICFESRERKEWIDFEGRNFEELFLQERNGIIMDFLMAMQDADKVTYKDVKIVFSNEDNIADQYFDFEDDAVLIKQDLTDWGNHYFGRNATKVKSLADYLQERVDSKFKPMHSKEYNRTIYALKGVKLKS